MGSPSRSSGRSRQSRLLALVAGLVIFGAGAAIAAGDTPPAVLPAAPPAAPAPPPDPTFDPASLTPYFKDKALLAAATVFQTGKGNKPLALKQIPAKSTELPVRFLRAQALEETGDDAGAAKLYEALASQYPALGARCHCLAAAAFERLGDLPAAVTHYGPCAGDPVRGRSALVGQARLLARLHKVDDALKVLDGTSGSNRVEVLAARAQILADAGRSKAALELYRQIYFEEPLSPFAERAHEHAKELAKRLKVAPPSTDLIADRIEKLLTANKTRLAASSLADLTNKPLCAGKACSPLRCHPTAAVSVAAEATDDAVDSTESEDLPPEIASAKPAKAFSLAKAKDPEDSGKLAPPLLPKCAITMPRKPADGASCRAQLARGWVARKEKQHAKALELLRPVYELCADPDVRAKALFLAQGSAASVDDPDARELALLTAYQFPTHPLAADALLAAANIARDQGDPKAERAALRRLVLTYADSNHRAEALFRLFWSHRAEGRPDRGLVYLDTLAKDYENGARGDGADSDRGRYWWGRTVAGNAVKADRAKGVEALGALMRDRPLTYYGLLARSFVGYVNAKAIVPVSLVTPSSSLLRLGLLAQDRAFQAAVEFWRMGDWSEVRDALAAIDYKSLRKDGSRGQESILIVAELLQRLGDFRAAHAIARRELLKVIRDGNDPIGRRAALVCYPLAFRAPVMAHATQQGFAPDFLQGLMREESALDPHARSPVGARGLTQLMPTTAKQVARSLGLKKFRVDRLWEPDTNIQIGSVYLGRMLRQFGHPGLAAAAYNAGPNAVARWLNGSSVAFDEFVEQIPFSETRGYVKRVLRSYAAYQLLYESPQEQGMRVSIALRNLVSPKK
jgi:soluble lytic murein transglycosylase-like protein